MLPTGAGLNQAHPRTHPHSSQQVVICARSHARLSRGGCGWLFARVGVTRSLGRPRWDRTGCLRSASDGRCARPLLAMATVPIFFRRQAFSPVAQSLWRASLRTPQRNTAGAPWVSRLRTETSPHFLIPRGGSRPPVECRRGRGWRTPRGCTAAAWPLRSAIGPGAERTRVPDATCPELWRRRTVSNWRPTDQGDANLRARWWWRWQKM